MQNLENTDNALLNTISNVLRLPSFTSSEAAEIIKIIKQDKSNILKADKICNFLGIKNWGNSAAIYHVLRCAK